MIEDYFYETILGTGVTLLTALGSYFGWNKYKTKGTTTAKARICLKYIINYTIAYGNLSESEIESVTIGQIINLINRKDLYNGENNEK